MTGNPPRVVICDYTALLLSITGLLRMSGYRVFAAHDAAAAAELCAELPSISLLVLNSEASGMDTVDLIRMVRDRRPDFPVLHIGDHVSNLPHDVLTLPDSFSAQDLMAAVHRLVPGPSMRSTLPLAQQPALVASIEGVHS